MRETELIQGDIRDSRPALDSFNENGPPNPVYVTDLGCEQCECADSFRNCSCFTYRS